ncbi:VOC family protein [uncultured Roseobacter sp.]|uniref:VOC family protein n=1 Tax=uncultured Roseobacter sp. TaxID=114847 RepID=UPI00260677D6|nr:VOC family protein [uncultured Roseobacter sp.]
MEIRRLDHVNIRTSKLDEMIAWYEKYLGLRNGHRPEFGVGGAWLYKGDHAMVHLVEVDKECASVEPKVEHFAFTATGYSEFVEKLKTHGIATEVVRVPGLPIVQVNLEDCDGNHIHVDFPTDEV